MMLELEWSFDPWREQPWRAVLALGAALLGVALVVVARLPALTTFALALAGAALLAPGLVPIRCRVDEAGISRRSWFGTQGRAWDDLRRATWFKDAVLLSPFARPHRLDAWRALVLPLPRGGRHGLVPPLTAILARHGL
jgi:hypothetical protein